jgi:hypothetical protein
MLPRALYSVKINDPVARPLLKPAICFSFSCSDSSLSRFIVPSNPQSPFAVKWNGKVRKVFGCCCCVTTRSSEDEALLLLFVPFIAASTHYFCAFSSVIAIDSDICSGAVGFLVEPHGSGLRCGFGLLGGFRCAEMVPIYTFWWLLWSSRVVWLVREWIHGSHTYLKLHLLGLGFALRSISMSGRAIDLEWDAGRAFD